MHFFRDVILKTAPSLSKEQQLTIRALADNLVADGSQSVKVGCELADAMRRPDLLVKAMRKAGVLPKTVTVSPVPFVISNIRRTAMYGITVSDLQNRREAIEAWVEFDGDCHFMHSGAEVFRVLCNMLIHGFKAGLGTPLDDPISHALIEYNKDPSVGKMLLEGGAPATSKLLKKVSN